MGEIISDFDTETFQTNTIPSNEDEFKKPLLKFIENSSYKLRDNKLFLADEDGNVKKWVSLVLYYIFAKIVNYDDKTRSIRIVAYRDENVITIDIPLSIIAEPISLSKKLFSYGVLIHSPALNRDYLMHQDLIVENIIYTTDRVGFIYYANNLVFVTPNSKKPAIGSSNLFYSGKDEDTLNSSIAQKGNFDKWLNLLLSLNLSNDKTTVPFLLFSTLLPLFGLIVPSFHGVVINIIPDKSEKNTSSNGKTTMQKLMLSVQGDSKWMISWDSTANAIEAKLHNSVGAYFDDLSSSNIKNYEKVIYSNANGTSRARLKQNGESQKIKYRATVIFSSGETSIINEEDKDGIYVRAIDVAIKATDYGSKNLEVTKKVADNIKEVTASNYGFIYPEVINLILKDKEMIVAKVDKYKNELQKTTNNQLAKRLSLHYACICVAGELFLNSISILAKDESIFQDLSPFEIVKSMFFQHSTKLMDRVSKFELAFEKIKQSINIGDGNSILNDRKVCVGVKSDNVYYIQTTHITSILKELNIKSKEFAEWLNSNELIAESNGNRLDFTKRIDGISKKVYAIKIK